MARARNIKPGFFTNDELVELPMATRLLFIGLWTLADREGRLEDRPKKIKMEVFPADDVDVDEALSTLVSSGFIQRYTKDEGRFIQVTNFGKHQRPHSNESASSIPAPDTKAHRTRSQKAHESGQFDDTAHHGEQGGEPRDAGLRPDTGYLDTDSPSSDSGSSDSEDSEDSGAFAPVDAGNSPAAEEPRPRSEKQLANDARHERRMALYAAWCVGVGLDPDGSEASIGRDIAFRHLKPLIDQPDPTPDDFEACTIYLASQSWRDDPPSIPQVIQGFGRWVGQGRPKRASPRAPTDVQPRRRNGGMTPEELAQRAVELRAQGR